jgi:phosphohistidine phosphatase SixA
MRSQLTKLAGPLAIFVLFSVSVFAQSHDGLVFLVRHADRASDAPDSALSEAGHKRARCLAHTLQDSHIKAIYATKVARTQQTAAPLAQRLGIKTVVLDPDDIDGLVKQLRADAGGNVLVVGHSDTLPKILRQLGTGDITPIGLDEYDRLFIFHYGADNKKGSVATFRYCDCP